MANSQLREWVRLDAGWLHHPKMRRAGLHGRALWVAALCWSYRARTDGDIHQDMLDLLAAEAGLTLTEAEQAAERLTEGTSPLWDRTADGWHIHDYTASQETRADLARRKELDAERQRRRRSQPGSASPDDDPRHADVTRDTCVSHVNVLDPEAEAEAEAEAEQVVSRPDRFNNTIHSPVDDDDSIIGNVTAALAARALQRRQHELPDRPIKRAQAWLDQHQREATIEHGDRIRRLINEGLPVEQIADAIERGGPPAATVVRLAPRIHCPWCQTPHPLGHCPHEPNA